MKFKSLSLFPFLHFSCSFLPLDIFFLPFHNFAPFSVIFICCFCCLCNFTLSSKVFRIFFALSLFLLLASFHKCALSLSFDKLCKRYGCFGSRFSLFHNGLCLTTHKESSLFGGHKVNDEKCTVVDSGSHYGVLEESARVRVRVSGKKSEWNVYYNRVYFTCRNFEKYGSWQCVFHSSTTWWNAERMLDSPACYVKKCQEECRHEWRRELHNLGNNVNKFRKNYEMIKKYKWMKNVGLEYVFKSQDSQFFLVCAGVCKCAWCATAVCILYRT